MKLITVEHKTLPVAVEEGVRPVRDVIIRCQVQVASTIDSEQERESSGRLSTEVAHDHEIYLYEQLFGEIERQVAIGLEELRTIIEPSAAGLGIHPQRCYSRYEAALQLLQEQRQSMCVTTV